MGKKYRNPHLNPMDGTKPNKRNLLNQNPFGRNQKTEEVIIIKSNKTKVKK